MKIEVFAPKCDLLIVIVEYTHFSRSQMVCYLLNVVAIVSCK